MSTIDRVREAVSKLPLSDADIQALNPLLELVEGENLVGAAAVVALQSTRETVEQVFFKRGEVCPFCRRINVHTEMCYLNSASGWNLLDEHEATVRENDELRAALAKHLAHNGDLLRSGGRYRSLKERARNPES